MTDSFKWNRLLLFLPIPLFLLLNIHYGYDDGENDNDNFNGNKNPFSICNYFSGFSIQEKNIYNWLNTEKAIKIWRKKLI